MGGWSELMPCNMNHRLLAVAVKEDIREAGGTPMSSEPSQSQTAS